MDGMQDDEQSRRAADLQKEIRKYFPVEHFEGKITPYDGAFTPELDGDKDLYEMAAGKLWTDVPAEFLRANPDAFLLLTDEAFGAFFPAWLQASLENAHGENVVREFLIYSFGPNSNRQHRLQLLSSEQRIVLRSMMSLFAECENSRFLRQHAAESVAFMDGAE